MDYSHVIAVLGMIFTVVGATWVLKGELAGIKSAIEVHVARDDEVHKSHEARILHLEQRRR